MLVLFGPHYWDTHPDFGIVIGEIVVVVVGIVVGLLEIVVVGLLEIVVVGVRDTYCTDVWEEGVEYQAAFYYQLRRTQPELE